MPRSRAVLQRQIKAAVVGKVDLHKHRRNLGAQRCRGREVRDHGAVRDLRARLLRDVDAEPIALIGSPLVALPPLLRAGGRTSS